jgi:hypothetical protein
MSKTLTKRTASELKPNDVIELFDTWFRVCYINYNRGETRIQLQREEDQLSPYCDMTCAMVTVSDDLNVLINVEVNDEQ